MSKTIFIDLDGTLVTHNYHPLSVDDQFLPGALDFLKKMRANNHYCILTTNRSEIAATNAVAMLKSMIGFEFDRCIYDLPVGIRIVINDNKDEEIRAVAIPVTRNSGLIGIDL